MYVMATTTQSAPWWGAPLLAGLFLLLGSAITLFVGWLRSRSDQALTDKRRWDTLILDTCAEVERICDEWATIGKFGYPRYIADETERLNRHIELVNELNQTVSKFIFVASDDLKDAAGDLYEAAIGAFTAGGLHFLTLCKHNSTFCLHLQWECKHSCTAAASEAFVTARKRFEDAARRELRAN